MNSCYIAEYFDAVELNVTFYRPRVPQHGPSWVRRTADKPGFTSRRNSTSGSPPAGGPLDRRRGGRVQARHSVIAEAGKFGGLLMQFPWSFKNNAADREWLEQVVEEFREFPLFLEVRHDSWYREDFFDVPRQRGRGVRQYRPAALSRVAAAYGARDRRQGVREAARAEFRELVQQGGREDERYNYLYSEEELEAWVYKIRDISRDAGNDFVFSNNHYRGQAAVNSLELKSPSTESRSPFPRRSSKPTRALQAPFPIRQGRLQGNAPGTRAAARKLRAYVVGRLRRHLHVHASLLRLPAHRCFSCP